MSLLALAPSPAHADTADEGGDRAVAADTIPTDSTYIAGHLGAGDHWYTFDLPKAGHILVHGLRTADYHGGDHIYVRPEDPTGDLWDDYFTGTIDETIYVQAGRYYVEVSGDDRYPDDANPYKFYVQYTASKETFPDTQEDADGSIVNANPIVVGQRVYGQINWFADAADFYQFTLPATGRLRIVYNSDTTEYVRLYDGSRSRIKDWSNSCCGTYIQPGSNTTIETDLKAGTYYLGIESQNDDTGTYDFTTSFATKAPTHQVSMPKATKVTIAFKPNRGTIITPKSKKTITSGSSIGRLPQVIRNNQRFVGWYTAKNGGSKVTSASTFSKSTALYAHWKPMRAKKQKSHDLPGGD